MKSMQLIDKKRVLSIVTAMNIIGYSKDPYVGTHKITGKERIFALNYLANEVLNEVGIDPNDLLPNAKAQSEDKNSEVMGFADLGFNAAVQASKMSSIYGGYFEENI